MSPLRYSLALGVVLVLGASGGILSAVVATETTANVLNVAPTVLAVVVPPLVTPTAGSTTSVEAAITVDDLNGFNDIEKVEVVVQKPDGSTHIASAQATFVSGLLTEASYTYTFNMQFYDAPALATSTYKVAVTVTDFAGATGTNLADLAFFNYAELAALGLGAAAVDFGSSLIPGTTSAAKELVVLNRGNVAIDLQFSGTNLVHATQPSFVIPVGNIAYSQSLLMLDPVTLLTTSQTDAAFNLAHGSSSSKSTYWQLTVPGAEGGGLPSGDYSGTLTVAAVKG